ncbi:POK18 protein, partial [Aramus guarauna]|nr:POK18 protein [Aramus guarauna]
RHAQAHFRLAFAALGVPREVKTDNGPAYTSKSTAKFFHTWGITHRTGIPHSPTGQAIVECSHRT